MAQLICNFAGLKKKLLFVFLRSCGTAPWRLVLAVQSPRLMDLFLWHGILQREVKVDRKLSGKMFSLKVLSGVVNFKISISWNNT